MGGFYLVCDIDGVYGVFGSGVTFASRIYPEGFFFSSLLTRYVYRKYYFVLRALMSALPFAISVPGY